MLLVPDPAVANGMVYAASDDGNLYALNASTGAFVWDYPSGQVLTRGDGWGGLCSLARWIERAEC